MKTFKYYLDNIDEDDPIDEKTVRARGLIINSKDEVLMCYSNGLTHYEYPGGHLEPGETLEEGLKREILEETGIELSDKEITKPIVTISYFYKSKGKKRCAEINYYIIYSDKPYDNDKRMLDEGEIANNYECRYIKVKELQSILLENKKLTKETNQTADDMLLVWNEYLKNNGM